MTDMRRAGSRAFTLPTASHEEQRATARGPIRPHEGLSLGDRQRALVRASLILRPAAGDTTHRRRAH